MRLRHAILWVLPLGVFFSAPLMAGSPEEVFQQVAASIVVVEVSGAKGEAISFGSGVIIAPGQIITNCHVIKNGKSFTIRQSNQTGSQPQPATLRYRDIDRDLCQLAATGFNGLPATITTGKLKTGQRVYAIGAPQGLELTISEGLISSLRELDGAQYIQTTAAISPGSSGSGLFDDNGRLIGITTFYFAEGQNLNFALPAAWIAELPKRAATPAAKPATDSAMVWLNKAVALEEKQDWPGLLAHSKKWGKARPGDADAWYNLGVAYGDLNQPDKAIEAFREALRINPKHVNAWKNLGVAYGKLKQTDKAIEAYREALRINPEDADAWNNLGIDYYIQGNRNKVREIYQTLRKLDMELADKYFNALILP